MRILKSFFLLGIAAISLMLSSCAAPREAMRTDDLRRSVGIYHKVKPKETLWRIAKAYDISVEELVKANNIPDAAHIQQNQLIFIPQATSEKVVVSREEAFKDDDFKWPIKGKVISYFGDVKSAFGVNNGIDIRSEPGQKIFPARGGEVVFADVLNGYGPTLIIDHADGYQTVYADNEKLLAAVGDHVTPQTAVSLVGGNKALAFLHFEIRKDSVAKNPLYFLP